MAVAGTWASVQDVADYTGGTVVTEVQLNQAQTMIEGLIGRVWRSTDTSKKAFYWLSRAVAWQAKYVKDNPELVNAVPVSSLSQDGFSVGYGSGNSGTGTTSVNRAYSPQALLQLNNMHHGANTSLKLNSVFQKTGRGRRRRHG